MVIKEFDNDKEDHYYQELPELEFKENIVISNLLINQ